MSTLFKVDRSPIAGNGVFALTTIAKGQPITLMTGTFCTDDEIIARIKAGDEVVSDPLQIGDAEFIDLDETSRSFNHSCNPNAYLRGQNEMIALREIQPLEEITYDYSPTINYNDAKFEEVGIEKWTCKCECGAVNCRGIIDQFKTLPEARRDFYITHRYLQNYMLSIYQ